MNRGDVVEVEWYFTDMTGSNAGRLWLCKVTYLME